MFEVGRVEGRANGNCGERCRGGGWGSNTSKTLERGLLEREGAGIGVTLKA
jgi:hypothetical protein